MSVTDLIVRMFFSIGKAEADVWIKNSGSSSQYSIDVASLVEQPGMVDVQWQEDLDVIYLLALRMDFAIYFRCDYYRIIIGGAVVAVACINGQLQGVACRRQIRQGTLVADSPVFQVVQIEE